MAGRRAAGLLAALVAQLAPLERLFRFFNIFALLKQSVLAPAQPACPSALRCVLSGHRCARTSLARFGR